MLVVLAVLQHILWISLLFHWETFIEHAHTFPSLSVESPTSFHFSKLWYLFQGRLCTCCSVPVLHLSLSFESSQIVLPPPWRTSTFASVTLPCNCLFTHLFPPGDSGLSEVGNFVLFHFAVSCCLQRNPEQKGGPPIASVWSATSEFGPS